MRGGRPSPASSYAIRFINTYQLEVSHRLGAACGGAESCSAYARRVFLEHRFLLASAKTLIRIARCRPPRDARRSLGSPRRWKGRARRLAAMVAVLGILGVIGALFSPASATVTEGCYGNANGRRFASITENSPLRVSLSQRIALRGGAMGNVNSYLVNLYFFGIPYGMRDGATTDNMWQGTFTASSFLTRGTGNYMVDGHIYASQSVGSFCFARLFIKVQGDPLSETPGQAAAGITGIAIVGMIATAITGGKVPPGFEQTSTPEQEDKIKQLQEEEAEMEKQRKKEEEENQKLAEEASKKCAFLVLPALLLTAGMMVAVPAGSATTPVRVRWNPRFSVIGIGSGILLPVGSGVLLQQYGVIWPTLGMGITFLVGGIALGIMVPTLARLRVVRKLNRRFADFETRYGTWSPTHMVPVDGLSVWDQPDPSTEPREDIEAGAEVRLVQRRGDWAQVTRDGGWSGWVDARQLEELEVQMSVAPASAIEPTAEESGESTEEATDIPPDWYPDPTGETRLRYWDGNAWTDHTAD